MQPRALPWKSATGERISVSLKRSLSLFGVLLAVLPVAAGASPIVNPSFESGLTDWTIGGTGNFGVNAEPTAVNALPTDGSWSARIYTRTTQTYRSGDFGSIFQVVDLTDVSSIVFDATLEQFRGGELDRWSSTFEVALLIDGIDRWTADSHGDYLEQEIDTFDLSGLHTIEFQSRALGSYNGTSQPSNWFMFDNLVAIPEPTTALLVACGLVGLAVWRRPTRSG